MNRNLFVVGGRAKKDAQRKGGEHRYGSGVILSVDGESGKAHRCVEYVTPAEACAADQDPSILFKAATLEGNKLYACTQTEILVYDLPAFELETYISLPQLNDVHHVRPTPEGTLLIANTGLDMVMEVERDGSLRREWDVLGRQPWTRFSRAVDYRRILSTKPHEAHPNFVFFDGDRVWTTRFEQRDAICLAEPDRRIAIDIEAPHDGIVHGRKVYFTTVDGHIVKADLDRCSVESIIDLNDLAPTRAALGWCRGLEVLEEDQVIVGFSRLRPTPWRQNLSWLKKGIGRPGVLPARVAMYDLRKPALCWEHVVEPSGLDAVFSIHRGSTRFTPSERGVG